MLMALAVPAAALAGGGGWYAQDASVAGNASDLGSVFFLDAQHGWALGSFGAMPSTGRPIVLATVDGGATWAAEDVGIASGTYADLRSVVFVDAKHG